VSEEEARQVVIGRLLEKAHQALAAASLNLNAGDSGLASNRVYYACFYAVSAVLLKDRQRFVKHAGVRTAMHKHLVHGGKLSEELGRFYDKAFAQRQEADYNAMAVFDAPRFVAAMEGLLGKAA